MKRRVAYLVVFAYITTIILLLSKPTINTGLYNGIVVILGLTACVSFLFGVAERMQLYKFGTKGEILLNTPVWFKTLWWISVLFVFYLIFADGFKSGWFFVLGSLSLGTAYLAPYLFGGKITVG